MNSNKTQPSYSEELENLRDRLLSIALGVFFVLGGLNAIASLAAEVSQRYWHVASVVVVGAATFAPKLGRNVRFGVLFLAIYLIAVNDLVVEGTTGLSAALFLIAIFYAVALMGRTLGFGALIVCEIPIVVVAYLMVNEIIPVQETHRFFSDDWEDWIHIPLVVLMGSALIIYSTDHLLSRLQISLGKAHDLVDDLTESQQQYKLLADNVQDVVWLFDLEMDILFVSPSVTAQRGFTVDEILSKKIGSGVVDEHVPIITEKVNEKLEQAKAHPEEPSRAFSVEYEVYKKDGSTIWVESVFNFLRDGTNVPTHLVGTSRDISERKKAESENKSLQHQVQQAQKLESLGVLAGGIAHDFNNLLLGVMGNADLALLSMGSMDPSREFMNDILSSAQRAADLCRQLLAYSGKGRFVVQPVDLSEVVREMTQLLDISIKKTVTVRYQMENDLPAVEADVTQIQQVIMNLVLNASEAIGDDHGTVTITIEKHEYDQDYLNSLFMREELVEGEYVMMEVSDTGCGMDEHTRERIFDPFYSTKEMGHGLGLAAVVGIVQGHGGAVKVYTEKGKGTTMKVIFPSSNQDAISIQSKSETLIKNQGSGTILVVDDESMIQDFARKTLEKAGYDVLVAENGQVALELFREYGDEIRLVLLDMTMPVMGGEETYRELRKINPTVKTILSSGFNEQDATSRFVGKGVAGFIQKPYRVADLVGMIQQTIGEG
jgi:PAS domain S-box-containing protein